MRRIGHAKQTTRTFWSIEIDGDDSGFVYTGIGSANAVWPTANKALFFPFAVDGVVIVNALACVNGGTVSGNIDLGLYRTDGTRIVSTGSTAQAGTNAFQVITVADTRLVPGTYYFGIACDNITAQFARYAQIASNASCYAFKEQASAFPLPDPATLAEIATSYQPRWGVFTKGI